MNGWDILILIFLVLAVGAAVLSLVRSRKATKDCCGDCSKCGRRCGRC